MTVEKVEELKRLLDEKEDLEKRLERHRRATYALKVSYEASAENGSLWVGSDIFYKDSIEYEAIENAYLFGIARIKQKIENDF